MNKISGTTFEDVYPLKFYYRVDPPFDFSRQFFVIKARRTEDQLIFREGRYCMDVWLATKAIGDLEDCSWCFARRLLDVIRLPERPLCPRRKFSATKYISDVFQLLVNGMRRSARH